MRTALRFPRTGNDKEVDALSALKNMHDKLSYAGTAEEVGKAFMSVGNWFGHQTCLILDSTKLFDEGFGPALIFAARAVEPIERVNAQQPIADDPIQRRARESNEPFVMSELRRTLRIPEEQWWSHFPPYFKGFDGMCVPIYVQEKPGWSVCFAGPEPDLSPQARAAMTTAAYAAHARFGELLDSKRPNSPLTQRESQCLKLVAMGKTDSEIGQLLDISPRTVRFHIGNAKSKLGVATRIQAVTMRIGGGPKADT